MMTHLPSAPVAKGHDQPAHTGPYTAPYSAPAKAPSLVFYRSERQAPADGHDLRSRALVAQALADVLGYAYAGDFDPRHPPAGALYFVPSDTLSTETAARLNITGPADFFGGVVPHPFVATKLISHPLLRPGAAAPQGWSAVHGTLVRSAVLPGYSAFSRADAQAAGELLLREGALRIKDPAGIGGAGQWVVKDAQQLQAQLEHFDDARLARHGLALECNLQQVRTHSVGQLQAGPLRAAYYGTQRLTRNHHGHEVYGGSTLHLTRGGLADLLRHELEPAVRTAVEQALDYHRAASAAYPGFFASRCNYDVAQGVDDNGRWHSGVLEQSWRIGGASGAEVAGLHALWADPALTWAQASTHEVYGEVPQLPPGAWVLFDGVDASAGRLTKYVQVSSDAHA